jgi:hypothetical protein
VNRFVEPSPQSEELLDQLSPMKELLEAEPLGCPDISLGDRISRGSDLRSFTRSRLTEVSGKGGGAVLTFAFSMVSEAQKRDESVLWLSSPLKPFYPSDAHQNGIDLSRLPVLFLSRPQEAFLASAKLLGSGGFGLLVWDLASWKRSLQRLPLAFLGRLNAMARHHRASVLILTDKQKIEPSLGCLVSLRLQVDAQEEHPELLEVEVVRDKRGVVGEHRRWDWRCRLPDGLPPSASVSLAASSSSETRMAG